MTQCKLPATATFKRIDKLHVRIVQQVQNYTYGSSSISRPWDFIQFFLPGFKILLLLVASYHYWKQRLCRVQNSLPNVKNRALGKDLLCRVLHSAKNCTRQRFLCRVPETRQTRALGKGLLCRVPDPRQNLYTRHRLPVKRRPVTAFFAERLRLDTRQRFVFFCF